MQILNCSYGKQYTQSSVLPQCHVSNSILPVTQADHANSQPNGLFFSELFNNAFSEQTQNYVHYFLIASATERKIFVLNLLLAQPALCGKNILTDGEFTSPKENIGFYFVSETLRCWYSKATAHTAQSIILLLQQQPLHKCTSYGSRDLIRL